MWCAPGRGRALYAVTPFLYNIFLLDTQETHVRLASYQSSQLHQHHSAKNMLSYITPEISTKHLLHFFCSFHHLRTLMEGKYFHILKKPSPHMCIYSADVWWTFKTLQFVAISAISASKWSLLVDMLEVIFIIKIYFLFQDIIIALEHNWLTLPVLNTTRIFTSNRILMINRGTPCIT